MNYIWAFMILIGIIFAGFHGTLPDLANGALESAKEAVTLCLTMAGVMSFWCGLMKIAEKSGIIAGLSRKLRPFLRFLFPRLPKDHAANEYIATNMIANIFGLGWAATPAGLKAMEELAKLEVERGNPAYLSESSAIGGNGGLKNRSSENVTGVRKNGGGISYGGSAPNVSIRKNQGQGKGERVASNEMCTFLILNISSLQLIPMNIIAYRQQYGSVNPTGIIGPAIAATAVSTAVAVVYCKGKDRRRRM